MNRLKKSFKAGVPLIPDLEPFCSSPKPAQTYQFSFNEGSPDCFGHPRLFSNILLERILEELGLNTFFSSYKGFTKLQYDVYGFAKLLIFGRLLNHSSKCSTIRQNNDYYEPILANHNPDNVYDTLDFIFDNKDKIIRRINTSLVKKTGRSPEIIYYDVTNFYFEINEPDEDTFDEEGNVIEKGLRKMGVCKEERKLPIVQMGLFMDDSGLPIAIESFPGNTLDHLTLRSALAKNIDDMEFSRFILIADRGICCYPNLLHLKDAGNGYIVLKSLLKSTKKEQEWTYSDDGYICVNNDFKYKSRVVKKTVKDKNGTNRTIEEKVIVYWSRKFQSRAERENKKFLDFIEKLQKHPENFRITATQARCLRKFFKKEWFSNNPNNDQIGKPETGETPWDNVIVFTYQVVVNKYANSVADGNKLAGAEFKLEKVLKDGTKTEIAVVKLSDETSFTFKGLDDGDYILTETKTPAQYNTIAPITFTVTAEHNIEWTTENRNDILTSLTGNAASGTITFSPKTDDNGVQTGLETNVINKSGSTLPSTGGMGTTIFYVVGSILVLGAAILLITKKRMSAR